MEMNKEKMEVEEARNNAHQAASLQSTQAAKKLLTSTAIFLAHTLPKSKAYLPGSSLISRESSVINREPSATQSGDTP